MNDALRPNVNSMKPFEVSFYYSGGSRGVFEQALQRAEESLLFDVLSYLLDRYPTSCDFELIRRIIRVGVDDGYELVYDKEHVGTVFVSFFPENTSKRLTTSKVIFKPTHSVV